MDSLRLQELQLAETMLGKTFLTFLGNLKLRGSDLT
jgi:hypothetical protein